MKIKKKILCIAFLCFSLMVSANFGFADIDLPDTDLPTASPIEILENIINWITTILALICVLVILGAGIMWATAGSDETRQTNARKMLVAAVVGLVIAGAAYGLVAVIVGFF